MRSLWPLLLAIPLAGCASGPVVHTDHDPAVDFSGYRTYAWRQPPPISNPLLKQRVVAAIEAELYRKGWRATSADSADVVLVANVSTREETTVEMFYDGPYWRDWHWRPELGFDRGFGTVRISAFRVGTLVLDMFDARTRKAIWRATAEETVPESPQKVNASVRKAVARMFARFPPEADVR